MVLPAREDAESGSRVAFFLTCVQLIPARNAVNPGYLAGLQCTWRWLSQSICDSYITLYVVQRRPKAMRTPHSTARVSQK